MAPPEGKLRTSPPSLRLSSSAGHLVVSTVDSHDTPGATTEIRIQRLTEASNKPRSDGCVSKAFFALSASGRSVSVAARPGACSVIARSALLATGEVSGHQVLGTTTVALATAQGGAEGAAAPDEAKKAA